jgi:prepilin-type N-terminal cleavage/methylation domain-containing protein
MKTSASRHNAFTLIELLTVIAILAVLMGLLFPALNVAKEGARKAQAATDVRAIVMGVKGFYTEYGRYPLPSTTATGVDTCFNTSNQDRLMDILRDTEATGSTVINTRHISYLQVKTVKNDASATTRSGGISPTDRRFYDPWARPYIVAIDANYDEEIDSTTANPSMLPFYSSPVPAKLTFSVVAYSYGKDNQIGKKGDRKLQGSDDIVSWQ